MGFLAGTAAWAESEGKSELAKLLEGRIAGEPVECVPAFDSGRENMTIVDREGIVFRYGDTIYVNRTANPQSLRWDEVLVVERMGGSRLCRHDRVYTHDRSGLGRTGVVFLEQFVPYRKAR